MCAVKDDARPNALLSILNNRCPRCRRGKLFTRSNPYNFGSAMEMPEHCPVCGQKFELQTGFYFGTGYVSYGLSVAALATVFVAWAVLFGLSYTDNSIFWCLGTAIVLLLLIQPLLQRLSRSIWIAFFVRYDQNWRSEKHSQVHPA
ncbi:DUF983 domain-containing protein [Rurimicrobium arvi]|uniref:DUF983 domain-containing protein n=1 Tax=Rurimicrobium arvi TaxID=2049916 RepID=A0ABP8N0V9_9BACT